MEKQKVYSSKINTADSKIIKQVNDRNNEYLMGYLNKDRVRAMNKSKIFRGNVAVALVVSTLVGSVLGFYIGRKTTKTNVPVLPDDSIVISVPIEVEPGTDILDVADKYYNKEYEDIYFSESVYARSIKKMNDLKGTDVCYSDTLSIPIIIDKENEFYIMLQHINYQINEIQQNEYWVDHIMEHGETISYLAAQASSTYNETVENTKLILRENGLTSSDVKVGTTIKTINPKLGQLKMQLEEVKQGLLASIQNNNSKVK